MQVQVRGAYVYDFYTYPESYAEAFRWLRTNSSQRDVVMSTLTNASMVVGYTGRRVFPGRWSQTVEFYPKVAQVEGYFKGLVPLQQIKKQYGITYLWIAREERQFMQQLQSDPAKILPASEPVYQNHDVAIYRL